METGAFKIWTLILLQTQKHIQDELWMDLGDRQLSC